MRSSGTLVCAVLLAACGGGPGTPGGPPPPDGGTPAPPDAGDGSTTMPPARDGAPPVVTQGLTVQFVLGVGGQPVGALPVRAGDITLERAAFWVDRMTLAWDRGGGDDSGRISSQLLDFATGPASFPLPAAPPAFYSGILVELSQPDDHASFPALGGMRVAFRLSGKTAAGVPFVVWGRDGLRIDLRAPGGGGAEVGARTKVSCVVRLDADRWLTGVPFPAPDPSGTVVIGSTDGDGGGGNSGPGGGGSSGPGGGGSDTIRVIENNIVRSASVSLTAIAVN